MKAFTIQVMKNIALPFLGSTILALLASCSISGQIDFSKKADSSVEPSSSESTGNGDGKASSVISIDPKSITDAKVLFVGNSFTFYNAIDDITESLGKSLGMDIECDRVAKSSQKLIDTSKSSDDLGAQFDAALEKPYTHIVLQEHSTQPLNDYASFLAGVKALKGKIDAKLPNAKVYLYSTWGFANLASSRNCTIPEAELSLRQAYEKCGEEAGIPVSYVGKAFSYSYVNCPDINLYFTDDKHPSYAGSYLAASTHLATLFGVDVRESTFIGDPEKSMESGGVQYVEESKASKLRQIAYQIANNLI